MVRFFIFIVSIKLLEGISYIMSLANIGLFDNCERWHLTFTVDLDKLYKHETALYKNLMCCLSRCLSRLVKYSSGLRNI